MNMYTIQNKRLQITVDTFGAELQSVRVRGKEILWQNQTGDWEGHAPVLFPFCGHCGMTVDGVRYPLDMHGLAWIRRFELTDKGTDFLQFVLRSDEQSHKLYPFDFTFTVTYRICESKLTVVYQAENPSDTPLYFACGGHESFLLDKPLDEYVLRFPVSERLIHAFHDERGYLNGKTFDFGERAELPLPTEFLQNGNTLIFPDLKSHAVTLAHRDGLEVARITFPEFDNLLLWRPNHANMICIEPWTNLPDGSATDTTEFKDKRGVFAVLPHAAKTLVRTIEYGDR